MRLVDQKVPPVDDAKDASPQSHGVGDLLKASRMRLGADLHDVASALRIRYPYLEAIEAGRYNDLPGATYAVGFIRAYADHLGLDGEEVLRRYKAEAAGGDKTVLSFPEPIPDTGMPGGAVVIIAVILAGLVYGGWYLKSSDQNFMGTAVELVPEELTEQKTSNQVVDDTVSENVTTPKTEVQQTVSQTETSSSETAVEKIVETLEETVEETVQETTDAQTEETAEQASKVIAEVPLQTTVEQSSPSETSSVTAPSNEMPTNETPVETQTIVTETSTEVVEAAPSVTPDASVTPATPTAITPHDDAAPEPAVVQPGHVDGDGDRTQVEGEQLNADAETAAVAVADTENTAEQVPEKITEQAETPSLIDKNIEPLTNQSQVSDPGADVADNESEATPTETLETPVSATVATVAKKTETASLPVPKPAQPRIVIKAISNGWIQIFDETKNQLLATRLLRQGDIYQVPDQSGLKLLTGKPDALEILVDGKQVPDITAAAAQQNGVKLDPALLLSGQATE